MSDQVKSISDFLYYYTEKYADSNMFACGVSEERKFVTYSQFRTAAERCALLYEKKGYKGGKKIALLGENSYEWILNFFAIELTGNLAIMLDKAQKPESLKKLAERIGFDCIIYSDEYQAEAEIIAESGTMELFSMKEMMEGDKDGIFQRKYDLENREAVIVFTSGTTGIMKGVLLNQYAFISNTLVWTKVFICSGNTVLFLPLHHMFGLSTHLLGAIIYGSCIYINSSLRYVSQDLEEAQPEYLMLTPLIMEGLLKVLQKMKTAGLSLPLKVVSGGAPFNTELCESFAKLGIQMYNVYGSTETTTFIAISSAPVTAGNTSMKCISEVKIDHPNEDGCGEILLGGPSIMTGYYGQPEETAKVLKDGWFHTGDVGILEDGDILTITGRIKNLIILPNGENIAPEELETGLMSIPQIKEVIVKQDGHDLVAEVYPENADNFTEKDRHELRNSIFAFSKTLPAYKRITKVEVRKVPFEKTSTMKIKR